MENQINQEGVRTVTEWVQYVIGGIAVAGLGVTGFLWNTIINVRKENVNTMQAIKKSFQVQYDNLKNSVDKDTTEIERKFDILRTHVDERHEDLRTHMDERHDALSQNINNRFDQLTSLIVNNRRS